MSTLCLTGWQQPTDALAAIAPAEAIHFNYDAYTDIPSLLSALPTAPELAIGWSLGAQVLVRAVAGGYVRPRRLVLLSASYQFCSDELFPSGPSPQEYAVVAQQYHNAPALMLRGFRGLIASGDTQEKTILRTLNAACPLWQHGLFWLEELGRYSCAPLDMSNMPPTLLLHGKNDKVASPAQSEMLASRIPSSQLVIWDDCAHAPHLHNASALRELIQRHV